ncbi:MAG TPA: M28 family metallopeptidase [Sediminibacterium sp.]|nr:M28 family metallopeptidase [Sediminibacterium sp.]
MQYFRKLAAPALVCLLLAACQNNNTIDRNDGLAAFSADSMRTHIAMLASDSFQGRMPFTIGETRTVDYLQHEFRIAGLEPGNGDSYLQKVPMVNIRTQAAPAMEVKGPRGSFQLKGFDDYVIWTDKTDPEITLNANDLVFAGYGIVAPEYKWNDYAGIDVKNKVVLVMVNDPGYATGDTSLFKGKTMTYYGRWTYKFEEAARQGAKGCLIIHNTAAASYPFSVPQNNYNTSRLQLDNRGQPALNCDVVGWVSGATAIKLFQAAGLDTALMQQACHPGAKSVDMHLALSTSMKVKATYNTSYNVIGKITGTKHPDEVIIYSAHWDHLGIGIPDEKGDSIYNGAFDNASGTAGLLELARAFKSMKKQPERTIVILSVTAEEQGLQGSAYYAQNPIYPAGKTLADINMDEVNPYEKRKDIVVVGRGQSELEDILKEEAAKMGRYISYEPHPEAGSYYRSDHFNFAKAGIPALFTNTGIDVVGKGKAYGQQQEDEYNNKHYHRPSDTYNPATWTMDGGIDDLKLLFEVGKRLAFADHFPQWNSQSEFKAIRDKK